MTEGKTDVMHLKAAIAGLTSSGFELGSELEYDFAINDVKLLETCEALSKVKQHRTIICIFDRDNSQAVKLDKIISDGKGYKYWGNNVFSFPIPTPSHRQDKPEVCIELYYRDAEIKTKDKKGHRLFLNSEFNPKSFRHETEDLVCHDSKINNHKQIKVIDKDVFDKDNENVALSKNNFAENIFNKEEGFSKFAFTEFRKIFDIINEIMSLPKITNDK